MISSLVEKGVTGASNEHKGRFALVAYLCRWLTEKIGLDQRQAAEQIIEWFRGVFEDFREDVTRYQVEHICGLRGGGKLYMPPSCSSMSNELGVCKAECGVKNPLVLAPKAFNNPFDQVKRRD